MAPPVTERGLKSVVWRKIKTAVFDDCRKEGEWKIMLLDEFTTKLLSSCCKMTDLLEEGITVVENIYKNREPVRQMKALYFISPTSKSVDCFLRDFGSKSENKYKAAYIYFTDFCPDSLFNKIKASCSKSIRRCKEINISFIPHESQVYTLDVPDAFYYCYSPDPSNGSRKEAVMEAMAEQIVTVCATLDENPGVRYKSKPLDNASKLAQLVEKKLEDYYKMDENGLIKLDRKAGTALAQKRRWPRKPLIVGAVLSAAREEYTEYNGNTGWDVSYSQPVLGGILQEEAPSFKNDDSVRKMII